MNQRLAWERFVEQRRRELREVYPCAMPTRRHWCPQHHVPVPQTTDIPEAWVELSDGSWRHVAKQTLNLTGICKPCRDGLYGQLAAEYVDAGEGRDVADETVVSVQSQAASS